MLKNLRRYVFGVSVFIISLIALTNYSSVNAYADEEEIELLTEVPSEDDFIDLTEDFTFNLKEVPEVVPVNYYMIFGIMYGFYIVTQLINFVKSSFPVKKGV